MKRWLLAAIVLLGGTVTSAFADYVIIIAYPTQLPDAAPQNPMGGPGAAQERPGVPVPMAPAPPMPVLPEEITLDPDAKLPFATAIVEVGKLQKEQLILTRSRGNPLPVMHRLTESGGQGKANLLMKTKLCDVIIVQNFGHLMSPDEHFNELLKSLDKGAKEKPAAAEVLGVAEYALKHGAVKKFEEIMDQFAKDYPADANAVMYLKVKAELTRPAKTPDPAGLRASLPKGYKTLTSDHYLVYHTSRNEDAAEVKHRLNRLENAFQSFYYWFGLKGLPVPIPAERQVVVVTFKGDEFYQLNALLLPTPIVADGFVSPREGVAVFSAKRLDLLYKEMEEYTKPFWTQGVDRAKVLEANDSGFTPQLARNPSAKAEIQTTALVLKSMEVSVEQTGISHNGSRQLLYASGLLNRNVVAPEWLQFGLGSFFETPLNSPNPSVAAPSMDYLPLFRDLRKKNRLGSPAEALRNIVTDRSFREAAMSDDYNSTRHARAMAWSLMYFLATDKDPKKLDGLQTYFKELSKMPRDMELDEETLLYLFCKSFRAFGLLDSSGQIDLKKLGEFAGSWIKYIDEEHLELQELVDYSRFLMASKLKQIEKAEKDAAENAQANPNGPMGNARPGYNNPNAYQGRTGARPGYQQPPGYQNRPGYGQRYGP
jgi:Protein of unknown function (DUF1570)